MQQRYGRPLGGGAPGRTQAATDLGCPPASALACLRATSVDRLVGLGADRVFTSSGRIGDLPWLPVAGTPVLPYQPLDALRRGVGSAVPLMQGTNRDEMRPFVAIDYNAHGRPVTADSYPVIISQAFGSAAPAVLAHYQRVRTRVRGSPSPRY